MTNKNLRLGITIAAVYSSGLTAALALTAYMESALALGGVDNIFNIRYAIGFTIGLIISFSCGFFYNNLLYHSIDRYANANPDMQMNFVKEICRSKLLSRYWGYSAAICLPAAALIFAFTYDAYIEALCLLLPIGFISLIFSLHYKSKIREIMCERIS